MWLAELATTTPQSQYGYRMVASDGGVFDYGNVPFYGSMGGHPLNEPVVGLASTWDERRLLGSGLRRWGVQLR